MRLKNILILSIVLVILIVISIITVKLVGGNESSGVLNPSQGDIEINEDENKKISTDPNWKNIGIGNFAAELIGDTYYFYNPINEIYTYNVIKIDDNGISLKKNKAEGFQIKITENYTIDLVKSEGQIFCKTESC